MSESVIYLFWTSTVLRLLSNLWWTLNLDLVAEFCRTQLVARAFFGQRRSWSCKPGVENSILSGGFKIIIIYILSINFVISWQNLTSLFFLLLSICLCFHRISLLVAYHCHITIIKTYCMCLFDLWQTVWLLQLSDFIWDHLRSYGLSESGVWYRIDILSFQGVYLVED